MTHTHHTLDYVELAAADVAGACRFYTAAFGWSFNDYGPDYAGIRAVDGGDEVGGINGSATPGPGGPLVLLWSDDLDATLAAVEAAGGSVVTPPYPFPGGRRLHFADPAGNELGAWSDH